jgi:predicted PurR-regulated permease PerM
MNTPTLTLPTYLKALSVLLLIIVIVFVLIVGQSILMPLFLAGLIGGLLTPFGNWLESKGMSRIWSTTIALLGSTILLLLFLSFVIVQIASFSKDLGNVGEKLNAYMVQIDSFLVDNFKLETGIGKGIDEEYLIDLLQSNSSSLAEFAFGTLGSLSSVLLLPVFIFFFLLYRDHLANFIVSLYAPHGEKKVKSEIKNLRKVVQQYIIGVLKVMAILAVLNCIALLGLGIKHAVFFAVFAAALNVIPYLGPFLGAVLPTLFAFLTKDSLFYPIGVVVCFQIIQLIESNFLTPKIVGSNVNLNAFVTFVGLLVGASIWGVMGMILIIPTLAVLRKIFELSESTLPFAVLLGEEKTENQTTSENTD